MIIEYLKCEASVGGDFDSNITIETGVMYYYFSEIRSIVISLRAVIIRLSVIDHSSVDRSKCCIINLICHFD